jgi:hypothetical protein
MTWNALNAYWTAIALRDARDLGLSEELDILLMLDVAVQNGGMRSKGRLEMAKAKLRNGMAPVDKRRVIGEVVASTAAEEWQRDVLRRKMCIADGHGTVHDDNYSLANWGRAAGDLTSIDDLASCCSGLLIGAMVMIAVHHSKLLKSSVAGVRVAGDAGALTRPAGKEGAAPEESAASRPGASEIPDRPPEELPKPRTGGE